MALKYLFIICTRIDSKKSIHKTKEDIKKKWQAKLSSLSLGVDVNIAFLVQDSSIFRWEICIIPILLRSFIDDKYTYISRIENFFKVEQRYFDLWEKGLLNLVYWPLFTYMADKSSAKIKKKFVQLSFIFYALTFMSFYVLIWEDDKKDSTKNVARYLLTKIEFSLNF